VHRKPGDKTARGYMLAPCSREAHPLKSRLTLPPRLPQSTQEVGIEPCDPTPTVTAPACTSEAG
jgi:hypothetical protein